MGVVIAAQLPPGLLGPFPHGAAGCIGTALHVLQGGVVHRHHAHAGTRLDGHVAHGHASLHAHVAHHLAAEFDGVAAAARGADLADHRQHRVLGGHTRLQPAVYAHQHVFHFLLDQALGGQHVLHFRGADTVGQGAQGAVGGGVGIAADDGHPGQGRALLRPHHMHNTLAHVVDLEFDDVEIAAVVVQGLHLQARHRVGNGRHPATALHALGGHVVVGHRQVGVQAPGLAPRHAQALESLGRGHFVEQVSVDIDQRAAVVALPHQVAVPQFVVQGLSAHGIHLELSLEQRIVQAGIIALRYR